MQPSSSHTVMKILSPLDNIEEVEKLAEAGAGEFYCGLLEEEWHAKYPVISINRRPAGQGHFRKFTELKQAVAIAHAMKRKVFFAVNEHYYTQAQYPLIMKYINGALDAGVDALILSDYGLMVHLKHKQFPLAMHVSTGGAVFNWRAVKFYKDLGAARITFPRHVTIKEMESIVAAMPAMETTVFIFNSRCINVDGFCTFQHGLARKDIFPMFRNACMLPYDVTAFPVEKLQEESARARSRTAVLQRQRIWQTVHVDDFPCGACASYEFTKIGITSLKIVGRGNPTERKIKDIAFLSSLLGYLKKNKPTKRKFRQQVRSLYTATYQRPCRPHMCYYPSVMMGKSEINTLHKNEGFSVFKRPVR